MLAVGLMSGTSLDGLDAVLCEVKGTGVDTEIKELAFETFEYPMKLRDLVKKVAENRPVSIAEVCSLNFELGKWYADAVINICKNYGIASEELGFVASHGQTVYHIPHERDGLVASTLQLGESAVIAYQCGCPVVSNFRTMDMAAGGEGAPLVPYSEYVLYQSAVKTIALQNIGGIGNVTVIPAGGEIEDVVAFDTGPGNMMINAAMEILYDESFDKGGAVAASGDLIIELVDELRDHPYLKMVPPKSTGREVFGIEYTKQLIETYNNYAPEDIIATLTWFTAYSIVYSYREFIIPKYNLNEIILAGGGVHNLTLVEYIKELIPEIDVFTQEEKGFSSDSKEAVAFVILGNETLHRKPSNVPGATGAKEKVVLGNVTRPN
ncbi:anhydro-N-acetylmuramic acid kinase AnmK [Fundicoccus culcitae]|uniref:Anhydro-N-acetylmuramic acid kinase n=1 Tax=Fundicoccus culcitae TaxID=2969821 RepID=A0ABY5P9Z0_9LACT|nr:anhydro-N-acetylmuramic acid kinase AnmK [Fundicoccus culcitae]UUX35173.1 anhydro-N-acetylmuramic acid kinase AnmK [Fundicoccus culcitae]